jgi:hypothetical protein
MHLYVSFSVCEVPLDVENRLQLLRGTSHGSCHIMCTANQNGREAFVFYCDFLRFPRYTMQADRPGRLVGMRLLQDICIANVILMLINFFPERN